VDSESIVAPSILPSHILSVGSVFIPEDRLWLWGLAALITAILWAGLDTPPPGLQSGRRPRIRAPRRRLDGRPISCNRDVGVGSALAGAGGILVAPIIGINTTDLPLLVIPVTAAALVGGFSSFPLTLLGATGIGIAEFCSPTTSTRPV